MLAQNFMTAADLGISADEHTALVSFLRRMERDEIKKENFNMAQIWDRTAECGTAGCIGGYVGFSMGCTGLRITDYVQGYIQPDSSSLSALYWPRKNNRLLDNIEEITPSQGAAALRNYLTLGSPNWDDVLAN